MKTRKIVKKSATKKNYKCETCKIVLKSELYYNRHKESKHPANPFSFICDYDGKHLLLVTLISLLNN